MYMISFFFSKLIMDIIDILNKLPNEVGDLVRQYRGINTIAYAAIREYYNYLFKQKKEANKY